MTTNARAFATLAGHFHTDEDRAFLVHHPGQMTVGDYRSLDKVEPCEITGFAPVRTTPGPRGVRVPRPGCRRLAGACGAGGGGL